MLGTHVHFDLTSTERSRSLVRRHFQGPDGASLPDYAQNVVIEKGRGSLVLPSALSDATGAYVLEVTDVLTGATAEASINMQ